MKDKNHLFLGVCVVRNVTKFFHLRRLDLLVLSRAQLKLKIVSRKKDHMKGINKFANNKRQKDKEYNHSRGNQHRRNTQ